jgi:fructokinase
MRLGALEAGGTKFRVAVCDENLNVLVEDRFATTAPRETIGAVVGFFVSQRVDSVGVSSFGPIDLRPGSPDYGSIMATPKPGWTGAPLFDMLRSELEVPVAIDTDVAGAALAEHEKGSGVGVDPIVYVTVGTGLGGAILDNGEILHGHGHSELGHIPVRRVPGDDFTGTCPFHGDCLEGMACGVAVHRRWGTDPAELREHAEVWKLEAAYLSQLVSALTYVVAPRRIIFGGGLFRQPALLDQVRVASEQALAGYGTAPDVTGDLESYVVMAGLGQDAGLVGSAVLARRVLGNH